MKIALVDNGSVEPAAHESLRRAAAILSGKARCAVEAVSWKHSDRIAADRLASGRAWTLDRWVRAQVALGERRFLFVPYFISAQGAIGSSLRRDLEALSAQTGGFEVAFTEGLATGTLLSDIVADHVRAAAAALRLGPSPVIVVDHGGPSRASASVRDRVADDVREALGGSASRVAAASMESPEGPAFSFNQPLLGDLLSTSGFNEGDVLIAPLFLSPGRHAGPGGDLATIAGAAEGRFPGLRCHFTELVGSHPRATDFLASALSRALQATPLS